MSKERELLKEIMTYFEKGDITIRNFENSSDVAETLHNAQAILAQPEQEPVAWMQDSIELYVLEEKNILRGYVIPLYTSPPKREPLIYEHLEDLVDKYHGYPMTLGRAIEKAHGITGGEE